MILPAIRAALWVAVGVAGLAFGVLLFLATAGPQTQPLSQGEPLGGPFALLDQHGAPVTEAVLRSGRPSALMFGFAYCPDVCPATLMEMVAWKEALGEAAEELGLVFVTVDPERDTPEALSEYLAAFSPDIVGITGEPAEVAAMLASYHVYRRKVPDGDSYTMDHTASVFLLDGEGRLVGTVGHGESREAALAKLSRLVGAG